jgi:predicted GNAT family acetyltransferase
VATIDDISSATATRYTGTSTRAVEAVWIDARVLGSAAAPPVQERALDDARRRQLTVLPFCPFVRLFIASHADYVDLVAEERRVAFELADGS